MTTPLAIGVDLGATKIEVALTTRDGQVLASRRAPTLHHHGGVALVCDRIAHEVRAVLEHFGPRGVAGVGIGSAGMVDGASGVVKWAVNLNWKDVALAAEVSRRLDGMPVFADNDANVNALGEGYFGSARGCRTYVLLTVGSGLGSGLVWNGRLVNGTHGLVSNLGHYAIDPDNGSACPCGHRGCAETIVCGPGLVTLTRSMLSSPAPATTLRDSAELSPDLILAAARAGDAVATAALTKMSVALGEVAAVAAAVLGPEAVILGGGLGVAAADLLEPGVTRELTRRLPPPQFIPPVRPATLASTAIGAACIVFARSAT